MKSDTSTLFGYSMGAGTAIQMAIQHPHLVRKLVLAAALLAMIGAFLDAPIREGG